MNYLILAMKRSGQHAIMNWIASHTGQKIYNNCCFGWEQKKLLTMLGKIEVKSGICNIEDFNPDSWDKYDFSSFPFMGNTKIVVIVRSADNWLASCYKRKWNERENQRDVYKYLMKSYINDSGERSPCRIDLYCKQVEFAMRPFVVGITYDDWFQHQDYREKVAEDLGFEFRCFADNSRFVVSKNGGGSSFDGIKYVGQAHKMNVLNRAEEFSGDKEFNKIKKFAYKRMKRLIGPLQSFDNE